MDAFRFGYGRRLARLKSNTNPEPPRTMTSLTEQIDIDDMQCHHCVDRVRAALSILDAVEVRTVAQGSARITYDPARMPRNRILRTIEELGYPVRR